ncbi:hypothetical protein TrRE_jg6745 [Triparma retinervis]|uniref:Fe2OG dioxygenase domain-containing protein n=1 Tax=Triparma retinervis TaxID=2557542 RepID=A0A9W7C5K5_9STRA|nr:hypothetical protein TrRE_jg6745 [Triparma retinervis]
MEVVEDFGAMSGAPELPYTHSVVVRVPQHLRDSMSIDVEENRLVLSCVPSAEPISWTLPFYPSISSSNGGGCMKMAQEVLPGGIFEDLIEALQDWRLSKKESECLAVAKLLIAGCREASQEGSIPILGEAFASLLRPPPSFKSLIDEASPALPPPPPPSLHHHKSQIVDDAAQKVLDYVVEHGDLPPDSDPDSSRPLFTLSPSFLPQETFESVLSSIRMHPDILSSSSSSLGAGFANTQGYIFRFSTSGIPRLRSHEWAKPLLPFFNQALDPLSNAFVLNVLKCNPSSSSSSSSPSPPYAVDWHRDATLALKPEAAALNIKPRLAFSVSVLYLSVPEDIEGGELHLRDTTRPLWRGSEDKAIDERIVPKSNCCCIFRGDAEHAVQAHKSECGGSRISVVLEQYRVPTGTQPWLSEFEVVDPNDFVRMS